VSIFIGILFLVYLSLFMQNVEKVLNLLCSQEEFHFCWFDNKHFFNIYKTLELFYSYVEFILVIRILVSVLNCSA